MESLCRCFITLPNYSAEDLVITCSYFRPFKHRPHANSQNFIVLQPRWVPMTHSLHQNFPFSLYFLLYSFARQSIFLKFSLNESCCKHNREIRVTTWHGCCSHSPNMHLVAASSCPPVPFVRFGSSALVTD